MVRFSLFQEELLIAATSVSKHSASLSSTLSSHVVSLSAKQSYSMKIPVNNAVAIFIVHCSFSARNVSLSCSFIVTWYVTSSLRKYLTNVK